MKSAEEIAEEIACKVYPESHDPDDEGVFVIDTYPYEIRHWVYQAALLALQSQSDELAKLKKQLEVAMSGLRFYSDKKDWEFLPVSPNPESNLSYFFFEEQGGGKTARESLAQIERIGEGAEK